MYVIRVRGKTNKNKTLNLCIIFFFINSCTYYELHLCNTFIYTRHGKQYTRFYTAQYYYN